MALVGGAMAVAVFTWLQNFLLPTRVFRGCQSFCIFYPDYFCDADSFFNRVYFVKAVTGFVAVTVSCGRHFVAITVFRGSHSFLWLSEFSVTRTVIFTFTVFFCSA